MLDENFPTYRMQNSSDNPLDTILFFTHNGSEPTAAYLLRRPSPTSSRNQYALGLLDVQYPSVVYAEVSVKPEWTQPTLSAAEVRAGGCATLAAPITPDSFAVSLYNPDQTVVVKQRQGSWNKSDSWEFEVPERSFKVPSASRIDRDGNDGSIAGLAPKLVFRWKRDGRLSKDMTCYMSGRSVGGKKSKEPDITVAMFRAGKNEGMVTVYEPNMARVDVEDRKGLELSFILSAEVIRDLYLVPRQDPFNTAGGSAPTHASASRKSSSPPRPSAAAQPVFASGALGDGPSPASSPPPSRDARQQADIDAETRRLQAMVAEEKRKARERERRDAEEQKRIKKMLEQEDKERRRREAEVERETERLRKEYGVGVPALPPRPPRARSVGPPAPGLGPDDNAGGRRKHSNPLGMLLQGPLAGPSRPGASGFFHRSGGTDDDRSDKMRKKRSVHF